jgi:hypothetical protein
MAASMRRTIQPTIDGVKGQPSRTETPGTIERDDDWVPAPGLDLFLREPHALLRQLQVARFVERVARSGQCGCPLATKGSQAIVDLTAFGKAGLGSPHGRSKSEPVVPCRALPGGTAVTESSYPPCDPSTV